LVILPNHPRVATWSKADSFQKKDKAYNELDALNFTLAIDNVMEKAFEPLKPFMSVFSLESPRDISDSLMMPKPVVGNIAAWMEDKHYNVDVNQQNTMVSLYGV